MGLLAYAGCTLILAIVIHAVYNKATAKTNTAQELDGRYESTYQDDGTTREKTRRGNEESKEPTITLTSCNHNENASKNRASVEEKRLLQFESDTEPSKSSHGTYLETNGQAVQFTAATRPPRIDPGVQTEQISMLPPSLNTSSRSMSPPRLKPATKSALAPALRTKSASTSSSLMPPPSAASNLRVPTPKKLSNTSMQPALAPTTSTLAPSKRPSRKVILAPGHSPLDWAALTKSTAPEAAIRLRGDSAYSRYGPHKLARITPSQLAAHTGRKGKDAWTSYAGKVYNISAYLRFHPGGEAQLLKGAGRSSDEMFAEVHPWVNWDGMLSGCLVGRLVDEDDTEAKTEREAYEKWISTQSSTVNGGAVDGNVLDEMD